METRSPLKEKPLHLPGQSLQDEIDRLHDDFMPMAITVFFFGLFSAYEWVAWLLQWKHSPLPVTVVTAICAAYVAGKYVEIRPQLRNLKLGREGERVVGQSLEALREKGYKVLHDIEVPGKFNVDHVIIGPGGVFVIETKTASKPMKGDVRVVYDGESVTVNGFTPDRNPVFQAKALADWVGHLLTKETRKTLPVRGVVLYPGWYVEKQPKGCDVWVLNETVFPSFLEQPRSPLSADEIQMATDVLVRYVRASAAKVS